MKRTLSLILALAMVMSLFATVSFATELTLAGANVTAVTYTGLPVEYSSSNSTATVYHFGSAPALESSKFAVTPKDKPADTTVTYDSSAKILKDIDTTDYYVNVATQEVKVTLATKTYTVDSNKKVKYTGTEPTDAQLDAGVTKTVTGASGLAVTLSTDSANNILATIKKNNVAWFTNVDTGYDLVRDLDIAVSITNGSYVNYTADTLKNLVATKLGVTSSNITALQFKVPASTSAVKVYKNSSTTATAAADTSYVALTALKVQAVAGYIGSVEMPYTATVSGSGSYEGVVKFSSEYAADITVTQYAPFFNEWFYLDAISGVHSVGAANATVPSGITTYASYYTINPSGHTANWSETYTAYTSTGVASQLVVTFVPMVSDMSSYVQDGGNPFNASNFEAFAAAVAAEQKVTVYSGYLDDVKITDVKVTNGYTLYNGSKALTYNESLTPAKLNAVTMDVVKAGTYYIDFVASYKYYPNRSTNTLSTLTGIDGRIVVYAGDTGDITYEVLAGDSVTFKTSDFQALYRKLAGNAKTLSSVTVSALPLYGNLYDHTSRTTNAYKVSVGDVFYVSPKSSQSDLDDLTYWASSSFTSEYSVYIPVTMYGTGGYQEAMVEIVINGDMPFIDVAKNSTFYEYIRYCYSNGIMGGKSATRFDATSSITRAQLVTTLYRMAGSPATHNNKTLPFKDTGSLSREFSNAVKWAYYNKIVGGTSATTFDPNTAVTRQAMVKILYGYAKAYGMDIALEYNNHIGYYTDGGNVSASMKDAMNWALDYGLLSGNGNKLNPRGSTSRGAAAKILANFHESFIG